MMKNIGKPCAGKPHARFDDGRVDKSTCLLYPGRPCTPYSPFDALRLLRALREAPPFEIGRTFLLYWAVNIVEDTVIMKRGCSCAKP